MGALALPSRAELEIVGILIIIAAVLMWLGFHDAEIKREALAPVIAVQKVQADEQKAQEAKTNAEQLEALHEATAQNAARVADARSLAAAVAGADRLRDDAVHRSAAASHPAAAEGSPAGGNASADMVPRIMWEAALSARAAAEHDAADLAVYADGLRASGQLCGADYDSLGTVKP